MASINDSLPKAAQTATLFDEKTSARSIKPRTIGFIMANLLFLIQGIVGYLGVLLGGLPQTPTDDFAFFLIVVAYTTIVYVIAEWYIGWPHISDRAYDFWAKFILTQTPYVFYGGLASFFCLHLAGQLAVKNYKMENAQT